VATGGSAESEFVDFAGIGLILNGGNAYDASAYTGVRVTIETDDDVYVIIKTADGGLYGDFVDGGTGGTSVVRSIPFSAMQATASNAGTKSIDELVEIHFSAIDPTAYGYAIHRVEFY
jgi:hypothetical protein